MSMTLNAIRDHRAAGRHQDWTIQKIGANVPEAAGQWVSFKNEVGTPGVAADPTTYANATDFAGTMTFGNVTPANRYLTGCRLFGTQRCTIMVADLLGQIGSITQHTSTGTRSVTSLTLPRSMSDADKANVECWLEQTTASTTTAAVMSLSSYSNEAGTAGHAGGQFTFPATATNARWMQRFPLAAGDKGVSAISTVTVHTTNTNGVCNIMLIRPLEYIPIEPYLPTVMTFDAVKRIYDGSSLFLAAMASASSAFDIWGRLEFTYDA